VSDGLDRAQPGRRSLTGRLGVHPDHLLLVLLTALWLLNVADFWLTRHAMWLGFASESNHVMGFVLRLGALPAAVFKIGIVTVGALLLWRLRRRHGVLFAGVFLTFVFAAVVGYQVAWMMGH
jgi:hypothetical protein